MLLIARTLIPERSASSSRVSPAASRRPRTSPARAPRPGSAALTWPPGWLDEAKTLRIGNSIGMRTSAASGTPRLPEDCRSSSWPTPSADVRLLAVAPNGRTHTEHLTVTSREMTILCLVAAGLTNSEVALLLHISRHTVAQHIADMLRRAQ